MSGKRYTIQLITEERERLNQLVRGGRHSARIVTRARILLKIDEGWKAPQIAEALDVSNGTVYGVKRRYVEAGWMGCCTIASKPTGTASWMTRAKPT